MVSSKVTPAATLDPRPAEASPSAAPLIRLGGYALLVGTILYWLGETGWFIWVRAAADPSEYPQPTATALWVVLVVAFTLILLGLPGLHAVQARRAGAYGVVSFVVLFFGTAGMLGIQN